jgi:hypothetical protein
MQPQAEEAMHILGASSDILIGMCWVPKEIRLHLCTSISIAHACYFYLQDMTNWESQCIWTIFWGRELGSSVQGDMQCPTHSSLYGCLVQLRLKGKMQIAFDINLCPLSFSLVIRVYDLPVSSRMLFHSVQGLHESEPGGVMMWKLGWLAFCLWAVVEQDALMRQEMVTVAEADCLACTAVLLGIKALSDLLLVGFSVFRTGACFA